MPENMKVANIGSLVRCYEGLRNWRALAMLAAGFIIALLLVALDMVIQRQLSYHWRWLSETLNIVLPLLALFVLLVSVNAAGLYLVDQADERPSRELGQALIGGIINTLSAFACLIIMAVGLVVVLVVLWILALLSKIPGIGPMFGFLLAGPSMIVLAFCYAVILLGVLLMFVAIWRGEGIIGALGRAIDIIVRRPLDVVLHVFVLNLILFPVALFVAFVISAATSGTLVMYAGSPSGFQGYGYGAGPLGSLMNGFSGQGMAAAGISLGIVLAAIFALFVLIQMLGNILIYDSLAASVDDSASKMLRKKYGNVRDKVNEQRTKYRTASQRPPGAPSATATPCAKCGATIDPGDRFCGSCGAVVE